MCASVHTNCSSGRAASILCVFGSIGALHVRSTSLATVVEIFAMMVSSSRNFVEVKEQVFGSGCVYQTEPLSCAHVGHALQKYHRNTFDCSRFDWHSFPKSN